MHYKYIKIIKTVCYYQNFLFEFQKVFIKKISYWNMIKTH